MNMNKQKGWLYPLVALVLLASLLVLTGCTEDATEVSPSDVKTYTTSEVESMLETERLAGIKEGKESVDVTSDNQAILDEYIASLPQETTEAGVEDSEAYSTDLYLGETVDLDLDDNEVSQLFDGSIDFDGDEVDTRETLVIEPDVQVAYSGDSDYDEDLNGDVYVVGLIRDAVKYVYLFEDDVTLSDVDESSPLEVVFLGEKLSIVDAETGEITYFAKPSQYIHVGESLVVEGKNVSLENVGEDAIVVSIDGTTEVIEEEDTETVNGLKIYVESTFMRDSMDESAAVLVFGEGSKQTVQDGDYYDEAETWQWKIEDDGTYLTSLSLQYDQKFNKIGGDVEPLAEGECLSYPNDYAKFCFSKTNSPDYQKVSVSFNEIDVSSVNIKVTEVQFEDDILELDGDNWRTVYTDGTSWYYKDGNEYVAASDVTGTIDLSDADYSLDFVSGGEVVITDEIGDWYTINADADDERLGSLSDEAESTDMLYNGYDIGEKENDVLTAFGTKIVSPQDEAEQDEAVLWLPEDRLEVELSIY